MIEELSDQDIMEILRSHLGLNISIISNYYYKLDYKRGKRYVWSPKPNAQTYISDPISFGIPIFEGIKKIKILPGILKVITNAPLIEINNNTVRAIIRGKQLQISFEEGYVILTDMFERKIAFGYCQNGIFKSCMDIGWYIREGS